MYTANQLFVNIYSIPKTVDTTLSLQNLSCFKVKCDHVTDRKPQTLMKLGKGRNTELDKK